MKRNVVSAPVVDRRVDPLTSLGEAMEQAVARSDLDIGATDMLQPLTDLILNAQACSLEGAAIQARALASFEPYIREMDPEEGTRFLRTLWSICDILDTELGVSRSRWGGDFFIPALEK